MIYYVRIYIICQNIIYYIKRFMSRHVKYLTSNIYNKNQVEMKKQNIQDIYFQDI